MRVLAWGFLCVLALGVCSARAWGEAPKPRFGAKNEIPAHGGWILEWDATDLLRFPWPTEPGALSGNYYVYEDDGRGTPRFRDLSPVGWSVAAERALLLRKRKERFGAFVGVLGSDHQNLTWTRPAPEDPLEPFPAQVECRPTGAVRLWIAEAADPESLWAGWHRVLRDEADRSRPSSGENAIPSGVWIGDASGGESVELQNKIGSRLRRLGFEGLLFSEKDLREKTALAVELGLKGGVRFDPLHVQEDELARLPFDAVRRTPTQEDAGRFSVRSNLSGRRWTRSRLNALKQTSFVWWEEADSAHPLSRLVATQRQKLRLPEVAATATPGASAGFRFADEATLEDQLWSLAWRSPRVSNLHTAPSSIPTDPSRFRQWLYIRALAQGSFWVFDEDIRPELQPKISALLPRITPKVHAEDLFRTNTETDTYPRHFRVVGTHREA
ncbi:MAG: hypothetical protein HKN21_13770, partial [Candidatus Eisenbacteria bacterium]|nr:hypothetical protein [Candidatus Eisenbacteria bacterium]